jgi:hypothetical protein
MLDACCCCYQLRAQGILTFCRASSLSINTSAGCLVVVIIHGGEIAPPILYIRTPKLLLKMCFR